MIQQVHMGSVKYRSIFLSVPIRRGNSIRKSLPDFSADCRTGSAPIVGPVSELIHAPRHQSSGRTFAAQISDRSMALQTLLRQVGSKNLLTCPAEYSSTLKELGFTLCLSTPWLGRSNATFQARHPEGLSALIWQEKAFKRAVGRECGAMFTNRKSSGSATSFIS